MAPQVGIWILYCRNFSYSSLVRAAKGLRSSHISKSFCANWRRVKHGKECGQISRYSSS